jgi:hypothetical protein
MKPPFCRLCRRDFRCEWFHAQSGGDVVSFADFEPLPDDWGGMAAGTDWFCDTHLSRARELTSVPLSDALATLESEYGSFPPPVVGDVADPTLWVTEVGTDFAGVFAAFRHATGLHPADARDRLTNLPTLVATGWPAEFRVHMESLRNRGATVEIRYDDHD